MAAHRVSIAVLMTSFNRREQTLSCLTRLYTQTAGHAFTLQVVLVDDASTDGTAAAVRAAFPAADVLEGTGGLYWNGGMRVAFAHAMRRGFDFYLLLNDDTKLLPGALERLLTASQSLQARGLDAVVAGATCDEVSGQVSYGGQRWKAGWKRKLELVASAHDELAACDTMNANCTLIPHRIAAALGNLDRHFTHSFGDFDYGFRAVRAGFRIFVAPGFVGYCSDNTRSGTWRDHEASLAERWRHLTSPKGSPLLEWTVYCWRHLGFLWPLYVASPYLKTLLGLRTRDQGAGQIA